MKAYRVSVIDEFLSEIVFADTPSKAKAAFLKNKGVFGVVGEYEADYVDLRCSREKMVDGMQSANPENIAYKLIKEAGWVWDDGEIDGDNVDEPEFRERLHDIFKEK